MTTDTVRIPLFPLPLVVLPGEATALHIFEPRYLQLISDVESRGVIGVFGISLIRPGGAAAVGCGVRVERFLQKHEDGKLDLMVRGALRYSITEIYQEKPYLEARVSFVEDTDANPAPSPLREQAISLHARFSEMMTGRPVVQEAEGKTPLSFVLASVAKMENESKQRLLESRSEHERLQLLIEHYQKAITETAPGVEAARISHSNGVIKH
jgi:ATP-dependent Lon protease